MVAESEEQPSTGSPAKPKGAKEANQAALAKAELELSDLIKKKKQLDKDLVNLESNLYALESTYLEETAGFGNIVRGFDQYLSGRSADKRRPPRIQEKDRIFSQSSATLPRSLEIKEREVQQQQQQQQHAQSQFQEAFYSEDEKLPDAAPSHARSRSGAAIAASVVASTLNTDDEDGTFTLGERRKRRRIHS
ncbi:MAG: hypothetical protein SGCHY_004762 [Lobulomycetales sp.]